MANLKTINHDVDVCVVGGGLAGLCAAVSAARHGAKVVIMQDRPMFGGNTSSEIRMWVCGARGENNRETGIMEEMAMDNFYRNPEKNYSIWDSVMFEKVYLEKNITMLLNCSCLDAECDNDTIVSIKGWQTTTQQFHTVNAKIFIDCSGDSILAPLTNAEFRHGREARSEYDESIAPESADTHTMGMSCLIQARETNEPSYFIPPVWAEKYEHAKMFRRAHLDEAGENFWYLELGGMGNTIDDTEKLRNELLAVAYGMWDYCKNDPVVAEENRNWHLDWLGMLPGKRESRRYIGDHVMTQNDVRDEGRFEDIIAYGGWPMDDHHPAAFRTSEPPTIFHPAPSPFGIPYRSIYSKNINNLMFAGRNISVTHSALSSTRVMATCGILGQAAGTAAAMAVEKGISPREIYTKGFVPELKEALMYDDCYLPFNTRCVSDLTKSAELVCKGENGENLRNGSDRPIGENDNGYFATLGEGIEYKFAVPTKISEVRIVFDSDLNRETLPEAEHKLKRDMINNRPLSFVPSYVPKTMTKAYKIEAILADGSVITIADENNNHQRLCKHSADVEAVSISLTPLSTWGNEQSHIFAFDVK